MKTSNVKDFLIRNYAYDDKKHMVSLKNGENAFVRVGSISNSANVPFVNPKKEDNVGADVPYFMLCGEEGATHFENALKDSQITDDYIISIEMMLNPCNSSTFRKFEFREMLQQVKNNPQIGIYRKHVKTNEQRNSYNLVLIRVSENGQEVTKYLDAYFAASDSRTYHDVKYTIAQFKSPDSVSISPKVSTDWPHNLLVFGAPGTGKSYCIDKKIRNNGWQAHMKRVTFYEDYTYEKFVGAYLPKKGQKYTTVSGNISDGSVDKSIALISEGSGIEYEFAPGVFLKIVADAWFESHKENARPYVLVIEEINRANAASVFGDFFQLLDRDAQGKSEYAIVLPEEMSTWLRAYIKEKAKELNLDETNLSNLESWMNAWIQEFKLPANLYLWATMNSADQGVYPLDAAFKRRWSFLYKSVLETRTDDHNYIYIRWSIHGDTQDFFLAWDVLKEAINNKIESMGNIEEDRFVGPWYFKAAEIEQIFAFTKADVENRYDLPNPLCNKLFQYLRQDVFRNNPFVMFKESYQSMSKMREAMQNGVALNEILDINIDERALRHVLFTPDKKYGDVISEIGDRGMSVNV